MCADRALDVVRTGKVFFPTPSRFNDPFDCAIRFDYDLSPDEYVQSAFRTYRKGGHNWKSIKSILDNDLNPDGTLTDKKRRQIRSIALEFVKSNSCLGVLTLTEDPLSILMWAHYGQNHQGACIGFRRDTSNALGDDDITHPVEYSDVYPDARFVDITSGEGRLSKKVIYTKARDWSYEKEWRLTCNTGDMFKKVPDEIAQVILGLNIPQTARASFQTECAKRRIRLFRCVVTSGQFKLSLEALSNHEYRDDVAPFCCSAAPDARHSTESNA